MRLCSSIVPFLLILFGICYVVLTRKAGKRRAENETSKAITEPQIKEPEFRRKIEATNDKPEFEIKMEAPTTIKSVEKSKDKESGNKPDASIEKKTEKSGAADEDEHSKQVKDTKKDVAPSKTYEKNKEKNVHENLGKKQEKGKGEDYEPVTKKQKTTKEVTVASVKTSMSKIPDAAISKDVKKTGRVAEANTVGKTQRNENNAVDKNTDNRFKSLYKDSLVDEHLVGKVSAYRKAIEYEEHLKDTKTAFADIAKLAKSISKTNDDLKIVLLSFVCKRSIQFLKNWLCNTKSLGVQKSVLIITLDKQSKTAMETNWPEIGTFALEPNVPGTDLQNASINLRKLQIINSLLHAGISLLLFDVNSVWLDNPLLTLRKDVDKGYDMLVNLVPRSHINTGFIVLFATVKTQYFWTTLYGRLRSMEKRVLKRGGKIIDAEDDYEYMLRKMIVSRSVGVHFRELPVSSYTEGLWYVLSNEDRKKTHPIVIRNNFLKGVDAKIQRAKLWNHWFLKEDGTCDEERVKQRVKV